MAESATLPMHGPQAYRVPTAFKQPVHLASFSYDEERTFRYDDSSVAYLNAVETGTNLHEGFDECVWREDYDEGLDGLLEALRRYTDATGDSRVFDANLVTYRGIVSKLVAAPYSAGRQEGGFELNVMLVGKTLYLEDSSAPETGNEHDLPSFTGYAFEQHVTGSSNVNTNVQWCSVTQINLGGIHALIGGEVDCLSSEEIATRNFVELKTSRTLTTKRQEASFRRHKLLKYFIQSFLLGVPKIAVGFHQDGILDYVETYDTLQLPKIAEGQWDYNAGLACAHQILHFVHTMVMQHPAQMGDILPVFRLIYHTEQSFISLHLLQGEELARLNQHKRTLKGTETFKSGERVGFLPAEWIQFVSEKRPKQSAEASTTQDIPRAPQHIPGMSQGIPSAAGSEVSFRSPLEDTNKPYTPTSPKLTAQGKAWLKIT